MPDLSTLQQQDNYSTRLASKYTAGGSSFTVQVAPSFSYSVDFYATVQPGTTKARVYKISGISGTTLTISGSAPVATYEGETPTAIDHPAGSKVIISNNFKVYDDIRDAINSKMDTGGDTMSGLLQFSGTDHAGIKLINLTTAQRTALTASNGMMVYDTDENLVYQYKGGAWASVDTGTTTPNASTTVAGVSEKATQSENNAGTATGGTGAPLFATPDVNAVSIQNASWTYAADAEASDAYAITLTPAIASYSAGQLFSFKANTANTGAATLNVNGLGAKTIKKEKDVDLETGDIKAGQNVLVQYDGTNFQMLSTPGTLSAAINSTTFEAKGDILTATADNTPAILSAGANNDVIVYDSSESTGLKKEQKIYVNVVTASYNLTTASGTQQIAHGLAKTPKYVELVVVKGGTGTANSWDFSSGLTTGSVNKCVYSSAGNNSSSNDNSSCIVMSQAVGTQTATAALDATNITLTWTKSADPTGTAYILAKCYA